MTGKLAIAKLNARCIIADAPLAPAIADRATRALRDHFPGAARRAFASWLDRHDESVWVVGRVDLTVLTAAEVPTDSLAASVTFALGRALGESLTGNGDGINVIRFANRAAYLGHFVSDVAAGGAWRRWYYRSFGGLKALPASAAIREALTTDPQMGLAALASIEGATLIRVTEALASSDESRFLHALAPSGNANAPSRQAIDVATAACTRAWRDSRGGGFALLALVRAGGATPPTDLIQATRIVADAIRTIDQAAPAERDTLLRTLDSEDWRVMLPLPISPSLSRSVVRGLTDRIGRPRELPLDGQCAESTRVGGLCLLLRDLGELPWDTWSEGWPVPPVANAPAVLRWLTLVLCAGRRWGTIALHDGTYQSLFGIPQGAVGAILTWLRAIGTCRRKQLISAISTADAALTLSSAERKWLMLERRTGVARHWCETLAPAATRVLRGFAHRLPGFSSATPEYLWRNFLAFDAVFEPEPERIVVKCDRPPLHLILALTGMTRGLRAGHDCAGRPILTFAQD